MILERIVVSAKEPLNKNVLWIDGTDIKYWGPNGWSGLDVTENDKLWTSIQEEIKDREDADIAITEKLDKEIQDRINAITTVTEALNKEVSDRQEADTSLEERLNQRIDDEIADRGEGDIGLTNKLNQEIADRKAANTAIQTDLDTFKSTKGEASGLAPLNESGKVDSQYLPSFVDDVVDVYATYDKDEVGNLTNIQLYSDPEHQNPITGEAGKIYQNIAEDEPAYQFRWTGTIFTTTGSTGLIIGEVTGTAYDGAKGKHTTDVVNSIPSGMISDLSRTPGSDSMDINVVKYIRGGDGTFTQDIPRTVNIPAATQSTAGVMSSVDKQKLDGLKEGTELETELQGITEDITNLSDKVGSNTYTDANYISKETNLTDAALQLDEEIKATNDNLAILNAASVKSVKVGSNTSNEAFSSGVITIANATTTTDGALSKEDKSKLDNIESTYLPLSGGTMTGPLQADKGFRARDTYGHNLIYSNAQSEDDGEIWVGSLSCRTVIESSDLIIRRAGSDSSSNVMVLDTSMKGTYYLAPGNVQISDVVNLQSTLDNKVSLTGDSFKNNNACWGGKTTGGDNVCMAFINPNNDIKIGNPTLNTHLRTLTDVYKEIQNDSGSHYYRIFDESNFKAGTNYLAPNGVTIADINNLGTNWDSVLTSAVRSKNFTVNGAIRSVYAPSTETFAIYAPTTSGTSGQVLVSRGEGQAPEWETMAEDLGDLSSTHYIQSATSVREALIALDAKIYELFQTLTLNQ